MSKMDELRALREARYAKESATPARPTAKKATRRPAAPEVTPPQPRLESPPDPRPADESLCGHRAISGRTCTRERGHAAKSHRYS